MTFEQFTLYLRSLRDRVGEVRDRFPAGLRDSGPLGEAVGALAYSLEELRGAEEKVKQQNDEITRSHEQLTAERRRYQELFDLAPEAYVVTDVAGVIREVNQAGCKLLNMASKDLNGHALSMFIPADHQIQFSLVVDSLREGGGAQNWEGMLLPQASTSPIPWSVHVVAAHDPSGAVVGHRWIFRDITRCRQLEESLRETRDNLQAILDTAVDAIITIDGRGIISEINASSLKMFGYTKPELIGRNVKMLMPAPFDNEHDGYLCKYLRTGEAKIIGHGREVSARRKDGSTFPADLSVSQFHDHLGPMFTGIIRDITQRKGIERHMAEGRLDEQQKIAKELHDGIGGMMTGIGMLAKTAQVALDRAASPHAALLAELTKHIRDAHEQLRQVAHGLVPVDIEPQSLGDALRDMASLFTHDGVRCSFVSDRQVAVYDQNVATQLFFIAQEAASNAVRHGKPSNITISLVAEQEGQCCLTISDDGIGFEENPHRLDGMGLRTMRYRAALIGASAVIQSARGSGTKVVCRFQSECPHDRIQSSTRLTTSEDTHRG